MKKMIALLLLLVVVSGCRMASYSITRNPEGNVIEQKLTYKSLFTSKAKGLYVESPDGLHIELESTESDTQVFERGFELGMGLAKGAAK